jgi:hypothetical protein
LRAGATPALWRHATEVAADFLMRALALILSLSPSLTLTLVPTLP